MEKSKHCNIYERMDYHGNSIAVQEVGEEEVRHQPPTFIPKILCHLSLYFKKYITTTRTPNNVSRLTTACMGTT
jgi:hypothetical protein